MHLVETPEATTLRMIEELALLAGIDPLCAADVAGAIASFCRARHGGEDLGRDYLFFLIERSGFRSARIDGLVEDRDVLLALRASDDPAALYEAYRRHLLYPVASDVDASGRMLMVNLKKIRLRPNEDTALSEWPVVERLAEWIGAWRHGNTTWTTVGICGAEAGAWRELMPAALSRLDEQRGAPVLRVVWMD